MNGEPPMSDKQVQKRETKRVPVGPHTAPPPTHLPDHDHMAEDKIRASAVRTQEILTKSRKVDNMLHQGR